MAVKNELDARLQHAVERTDNQGGVTVTYPASAPLKGEIVFTKDSNDKIDNFKVGDGDTYYANLPKFLPEWTRNANKPTYTASEVGALPDSTTFVSSFNGDTGAVTYTAPVTSVNNQTGDVTISTGENNIIEAITFNGNTAPITNKTAAITGKVISSVTKDTSVIPNVTTITYSDGSTTTVVDGKDGTSFNIKGTVTSPNNLPSTGQTLGDGYIISGSSTASENGHLWVYTGTGAVHGFTDCGNIQGPQGVQGEQGVGIGSIVPPGTPGQTTDVYTIMSDEQTPSQLGTFTVYNGEDGAAGIDGSTWYQGTAVNAATSSIPTGIKVGDYYLNITTYDIWKCISITASAKWSLVCNIRGSKWFYGSASPAAVSGSKSGDMYLNTSDGGVWIRSNGSTESWQYIASIKGPQGQNGTGFYYLNDSPSSSTTSVLKQDVVVPSGRILLQGDLIIALNGNVFRITDVTDTSSCIVSYVTCLKGADGSPTVSLRGGNISGVTGWWYDSNNPLTINSSASTGYNISYVLAGDNITFVPLMDGNTTIGYKINSTGGGSGSAGNGTMQISANNLSAVNTLYTANTASALNAIKFVNGSNTTVSVTGANGNTPAQVQINATYNTATSTTNGLLSVVDDIIDGSFYIDSGEQKTLIPIYWYESEGKHCVNIYDIIEAITSDEDLRMAFNKALNGEE